VARRSLGYAATADAVLDLGRVNPGPLDGMGNGMASQDRAVRLVESAPERFPDRRSGGGYDDSV
jgi:hypothetical protein